jgi:hypothetical protein
LVLPHGEPQWNKGMPVLLNNQVLELHECLMMMMMMMMMMIIIIDMIKSAHTYSTQYARISKALKQQRTGSHTDLRQM